MEYTDKLHGFGAGPADHEIDELVGRAEELSRRNSNADVHRNCFACLDLTMLDITDSEEGVAEFAGLVMALGTRFPDMPAPAAICVYPNFVSSAGLVTGDSGMRIASVAGGFPSGQTYLEVKMLEAAMAVENGADEIDMVMSVGQMLTGHMEETASEIEMLRDEIGQDVTLKVILETGVLPSYGAVRQAAMLAMLAGADFIKTSTGKSPVSATPAAAVAMCCAIRDFHARTGRRVGFKAAGGIRTSEQATLYYSIVESVLGPEWLGPQLFRIGASSLANSILSSVEGRKVNYF